MLHGQIIREKSEIAVAGIDGVNAFAWAKSMHGPLHNPLRPMFSPDKDESRFYALADVGG
jgi:hypothetical protein